MIKRKNFFAEPANYGDIIVSTMSIWGILGLLDKSVGGIVLFGISVLGVVLAAVISKKLQKIDDENERNEIFND